MKQIIFLTLFCLSILFTPASVEAVKPKAFSSQEEAECYLTTHYNLACEHYNDQAWRRASNEFEKVIYFFPCSDEASRAYYYLGICYFYMNEYDFANLAFTNYLKGSEHPEFFEDAVNYKFCIAESFRLGKKKRLFTMRYCPRIESAQTLALTIYDEVIIALPYCDLTAQALYSKAELLKQKREYREAIETYQTLIRRFPKHEIAPACYLGIQDAYCQQSRFEFQNPDLIALTEINARRFREEFPRDERVAIADDLVLCIKENYAKGLCDIGLLFERKGQPEAAAIYFQSAIEEFPNTRVAQHCRCRLRSLGYEIQEDEVPTTSVLTQFPQTNEPPTGSTDAQNPLGPELPTGPEAIRDKDQGVPIISGSLSNGTN